MYSRICMTLADEMIATAARNCALLIFFMVLLPVVIACHCFQCVGKSCPVSMRALHDAGQLIDTQPSCHSPNARRSRLSGPRNGRAARNIYARRQD
jgi:hypothetical protein